MTNLAARATPGSMRTAAWGMTPSVPRTVLDGPLLLPSGGAADEIILVLHGVASNGHVLSPLAAHLRKSFPRALIAAPHAPHPSTYAAQARQWWQLDDFGSRALARGVRAAVPTLHRFIDDVLAASGLSEERLILAGFSQGAMLALHAGLTRRRPVAGVIAYSGALAYRALPWRPFAQRPPVLLVHGAEDTVIPAAALHDAAERLRAYRCPVQVHLRPGLGHAVDGKGYVLGTRFAERMLRYEAAARLAAPRARRDGAR